MNYLYNSIFFQCLTLCNLRLCFSSNKSNAQTTSKRTTTTTTNAQSAALEDINSDEFLSAVDSNVTINNADSKEIVGMSQAFLGETFASVLNFANNNATQALEVISARDLEQNENIAEIGSEEKTNHLLNIGIVAAVGALAYKVLK